MALRYAMREAPARSNLSVSKQLSRPMRTSRQAGTSIRARCARSSMVFSHAITSHSSLSWGNLAITLQSRESSRGPYALGKLLVGTGTAEIALEWIDGIDDPVEQGIGSQHAQERRAAHCRVAVFQTRNCVTRDTRLICGLLRCQPQQPAPRRQVLPYLLRCKLHFDRQRPFCHRNPPIQTSATYIDILEYKILTSDITDVRDFMSDNSDFIYLKSPSLVACILQLSGRG